MNRKLLESVKRNLNHVEKMLLASEELILGKDYPLARRDLDILETIKKVYEQQKQM